MRKTLRTPLLLLLIAGLALVGQAVVAGQTKIPVARDLQADAELAREKGVALMLAFTAYYCSNCEILENEIVRPMVKSGEYDDKVLIRKVRLDEGDVLTNFSGENERANEFAHRKGVMGMPTLMFLDPNGKLLAEPILGINTVEMFGGRVDRAIERSLELMKEQHMADHLAKNP